MEKSKFLLETILTEGSLSRVLSFIKNHRADAFCIISAYSTDTPEQNHQRHQELTQDLNSLHLGPHDAIGFFDGNREESCFVPLAKEAGIEEPEFRKIMLKLSKQFDQWGVVYGDVTGVMLLRSDGKVEKRFSRVKLTEPELAQAYTILRKKQNVAISFE